MPRAAFPLALALLAAAAGARADDVDDLIRRANDLRRDGQDAEALALLERGWRASPSPRVRAQMGFAAQALGRWLDADVHLRAALAAPDAWVGEHRAIVEDALRTIGRHVASFEVRCDAPGATLHVDGLDPVALPLAAPLRVAAGVVRYEVRAEGYAPTRRESQAPAAMLTRDEVVLLPPGAAGVPAASAWGPQRAVAVATSAGAAAGVGLGVAMLLVRNAAADRWNAPACLAGDRTRAENCEPDRAAAETAGAVSAAGFAAGGALAVTAAVLWLTAPSSRGARAMLCGPGANGLACGGRF